MAAGDGKSPLNSVWLNAQTDLLRAKVNFGDADTTEATVFTNWYLGTATTDVVLSADPGSYNLTGSAATLLVERSLSADLGSYSFAGSNATLNVTTPSSSFGFRKSRQQFAQQPQIAPQIDRSNSLSRNLETVILPTSRQIISRGGSWSAASTPPSVVDRLSGRSLQLAGNTNTGYWNTPAGPWVNAGTGWTILAVATMRTSNTSNAIATVADGPGGGAHDRSLLITGGNQVRGYVYDGSPRTITGTTTLSVGQTFVSAAKTSREGGVNRFACFLNGKLENQLNISDNGYTAYSAPQIVAGYGGGGDSTLTSNIDLALLLVFSRGLSDSEIKNLSDNPWQIFATTTNPVFYSSPASGSTVLVADSGAYNLTGAPAELFKTGGVTLSADSGSYSLVGSDATLNRTRTLSADSGAYNLTGSSAELNISRSLSADSGAYNVTGAAATLTRAKVISADAGGYALDGQAASFIRTYNLLAAAGAFNLTGSDATLSTAKTLSAEVGSYSITGSPASLTKFSVFPDPGDVRAGVVYGPGGIYVGTLVTGGKILYIFDD